MIIERILIVDRNNQEAGEYSFKAGANLLVSQDNSQGKSSLLKTMYYCLGLDIKHYPSMWDPRKMIVKLDLYNERTKEQLYIVRVNDLFYVNDNEEPLSLSQYTKWLSEQLGVDMKLTLKKTNMTRSISHPSALITPFYIDQDDSWARSFFSSNNEVQMYSGIPKTIFDFVFNITDDEELKAKEELKRLTNKRSSLSTKRESINDVYMDYIDEEHFDHDPQISAIINPMEENKKNIDLFIGLMDEANKRYIKSKATRIKLQRALDQLRKDQDEYHSILKMLNSDYEFIKSVCKHCNSQLTEEQVKTRMNISTDIFEIHHLIDTTKKEIALVETKVVESQNTESESNAEYERLAKELEINSEVNTIAEYIEEASKKKSQEEFATIISELDSDLGSLDSDIKEKQKEMRDSVKKAQTLIEKIEKSYREHINELSIIMRGSNVNMIEFKDFTAPKSSGVNVNQTYLGIYLTYMRLISEYGRYKLPFCIDSFIKNETAGNRLNDMFEATEKYLIQLSGQSIFSAIEEYVQLYMKNTEKFNRVDIGQQLLSAKAFDQKFKEVKDIVISQD